METNYSSDYNGHKPSNEQIQFVADNFKKFNELYPESILDMGCGYVNEQYHHCGTVHCHGGNYAALALHEGRLNGIVDFGDGAILIAKDLGFRSGAELKVWAYANPEVWGNGNGGNMFSDRYAFYKAGVRPFGAESNVDIANHWQEVAERNY